MLLSVSDFSAIIGISDNKSQNPENSSIIRSKRSDKVESVMNCILVFMTDSTRILNPTHLYMCTRALLSGFLLLFLGFWLLLSEIPIITLKSETNNSAIIREFALIIGNLCSQSRREVCA